MYYKDRAAMVLREAGFDTLPSISTNCVILDKGDPLRQSVSVASEGALDRGSIHDIANEMLVNGSSVSNASRLAEDDTFEAVHAFFTTHNITRAIVKPIAAGGRRLGCGLSRRRRKRLTSCQRLQRP